MTARCKACGVRTTSYTGYCQSCKAKRRRGYKRIKEENLLLDEAGGAWWIWNPRGDVVVAGKPTKDAAVIALATGDVEDDDDAESAPEAKTPAQLEREIATALANRPSTRAEDADAGVFYLTDTKEQPLGPEFQSRLTAKRAAMKLVREGSHPRVEVWHRWHGGRYMQGLASEDGWSDV